MKTEFFSYADLTWPEVKALSRDTPLVLPLGAGYDLQALAEALGDSPRVGLLPALPFGWEGSGLEVPKDFLGACLSNLLDGLREDGFQRVHTLTPQSVHLETGASAIKLDNGSSTGLEALPPDSERSKVILIPIGHTEQHGLHLPLCTDTVIIETIGQGTARSVPEKACCLPTTPYGVSMHRRAFAGTLTTGGRAFEDFCLAVVDALTERGFDRFYFLSGHGGNGSFLTNVVKYAGDRHRRIFCATAGLYLSGPEGVTVLEKHRRSKIGGMGHACELETSLMLHLRPELVHMELVVDEVDFVSTPAYYMDWVEGGALISNPAWDDDSRTGAYGAGSLASAEHGKIWLDTAVAEKVTHVAEIHEQHTRREERRNSGYGLWGDNQ